MKISRLTLTLAVAFGVLIVLLVFVGYWGVDQLVKMNREVQVIVNQRWQMIQLSREALRYSALNSRITMEIFLVQDRNAIPPLLEQRADNTKKISELLRTIEGGLESETEKVLVANIWSARVPYINSYERALHLLLQENKPEAGRGMMAGVVLANLAAYHKTWEDYVEYQSKQMDAAGDAAKARYAATRQELITLVVAATVLAAAIALFVIRNLNREINERRLAEENLQRSQTLLRVAGRLSRVGAWSVEQPGSKVIWSDEVCAIHEVPPGFTPTVETAVHFYAPAYRETITKTFEACVRDGTPFDVEVQLITAKGQRPWVRTIGEAERDAAGVIWRVQGALQDITARKLAEAELKQAHLELVVASRRAGMAEAATGILHNVGNVLNSVNVASSCLAESLRKSKSANLGKVVELLRDHEKELGDFFTHNPKGLRVLPYLALLATNLTGEQAGALKELDDLQKNIAHIKEVVAAQQRGAKGTGKPETLRVADLVEDALRMDSGGPDHAEIQVTKEFGDAIAITVDKHKVLQILLNLVRNAKQSCHAAGGPEKRLTVCVTRGEGRVRIVISDNGVGISPENLARIFTYGFTTREEGHGFGLHSAMTAAKEMGGALTAYSEGLGRGATFTLDLPLARSG